MWTKWKEYINQNPKITFKEYFREEVLKQVKTIPAALEGHQNTPIDIATIYFAYPNGQLIKLLDKRGDNIIKNNEKSLKKCGEIEEKIANLLKEKNEEFKRPVAAFVTFIN